MKSRMMPRFDSRGTFVPANVSKTVRNRDSSYACFIARSVYEPGRATQGREDYARYGSETEAVFSAGFLTGIPPDCVLCYFPRRGRLGIPRGNRESRKQYPAGPDTHSARWRRSCMALRMDEGMNEKKRKGDSTKNRLITITSCLDLQ